MESEKSFLMRLLRRLGSCQHALSEQNKVSCLDYKVKNLIYAGAFLDIIGKLTDRILAIDELQKKGKEKFVYVFAFDPKIGRRVTHVVLDGYAISMVTGHKFKIGKPKAKGKWTKK